MAVSAPSKSLHLKKTCRSVHGAATQFGDSEIWTATAPALLTGVTVSSTQASSARQSLTVIVFSGASGVGASAVGGAATGAASASLVTSSVNSLVYAVGESAEAGAAAQVRAAAVAVLQLDRVFGAAGWTVHDA